MVPSFTARGKPVCWKWSKAWLLPPVPSKYLRPQNTLPSVRFIHRFSCRSHTSHRQPLGEGVKELVQEGDRPSLIHLSQYFMFYIWGKNTNLKSNQIITLHISYRFGYSRWVIIFLWKGSNFYACPSHISRKVWSTSHCSVCIAGDKRKCHVDFFGYVTRSILNT